MSKDDFPGHFQDESLAKAASARCCCLLCEHKSCDDIVKLQHNSHSQFPINTKLKISTPFIHEKLRVLPLRIHMFVFIFQVFAYKNPVVKWTLSE